MLPSTKRILWASLAGGLTLVLTFYWRGFPYRFAVLSSVMVAALTYSAFRATERLRHLYRRD